MTDQEKEFREVLNEPSFKVDYAFCLVVNEVTTLGLGDGIIWTDGTDAELGAMLFLAAQKEKKILRVIVLAYQLMVKYKLT